MKRKFLFLYIVLSFIQLNAQEFVREWGTYYGPVDTFFGNATLNTLQFDSSNNINLLGSTQTNSAYQASYYNQFATSGAGYDITKASNILTGIINPSGAAVSSGYVGNSLSFDAPNMSFNNTGERFAYQFSNTGITGTSGTAGTWFPTAAAAEANKILLSKYSNTGVLQWKTFLPSLNTSINEINHDSAGNTFIIGTTLNQNIGTAGSFQPSFVIRYDNNGNVMSNSYIAKLNSSGQLVWATYFPAQIQRIKYYNGNLYLTGGDDDDPALTQMATTNAFQSLKTNLSITKLNAADGSRIWGTYYGPAGINFLNLNSGIAVNDTGLYVAGDIFDFTGSNNTYFSTPGSFQTTPLGSGDIYLTKFNHDGGREWSTYFGSSSDDISSFNNNSLSVYGRDIYLTGVQTVAPNSVAPDNLATPGAHLSSPPPYSGPTHVAHNYLFFAKFNSDGSREWSSYYGGAGAQPGFPPSLSISVFNADTFYVYGTTRSTIGISSTGAIQPTGVPNVLNGYIAKFNRKVLSTSENPALQDLVLYDNPNNGIFTIEGHVLRKKDFNLNIFDMSGRLLYTQKMNGEQKQIFNYQGRLQTGTYSLQVSAGKDFSKNFKMIVK
ncbi:T9SS type A sorting domain-containing protein [Chryseobacterium caseinilyticum]|uniref:T9SS type A sorting domain-containing protein n=1 Tax=Chryseobacterium caseinilyticum TaxID=2771428 RepID=A0ABR8ZFI3_9FLAO|nr:T9SS type A sorting domain-containing protein [Chryseobacterium caseinilyticum]MBD8084069.1 T9SS type A sorting domain-containing protein [Chryseobacterium caseinilyticum]